MRRLPRCSTAEFVRCYPISAGRSMLRTSICSARRSVVGQNPDVVIYTGDPANELAVLQYLPSEKILVYPSELGEIDNPRGDDRAAFEKQAAR